MCAKDALALYPRATGGRSRVYLLRFFERADVDFLALVAAFAGRGRVDGAFRGGGDLPTGRALMTVAAGAGGAAVGAGGLGFAA